jgi:hypothetical protein
MSLRDPSPRACLERSIPSEKPRAERSSRNLVVSALLALGAASAGCAGADVPTDDGDPRRVVTELSVDDDTDVKVLEPKLPKVLELEHDWRWPGGDGYGDALDVTGDNGCRVNCCTMSVQKIFDPVRQVAIHVPIVVCN